MVCGERDGARSSTARRTSQASSAMSRLLQPGQRFGPDLRYQLDGPLGTGGSGVVHEVHDRLLGCRLAGKFVFPEVSGADAVLRREAQLLARLQHENIISARGCGLIHDVPYLLMDLLEGDTLASVLVAQKLSHARATRVLVDVVQGLEHAHARGVLHLDIKPGNVFVQTNGRAKIIDFGAGSVVPTLASTADLEPVEPFLKGTLHYMAPEQWAMSKPDVRTDIWAAGMVLYEMLRGMLPYGDQPSCLRIMTAEPEDSPCSTVGARLPPDIRVVIGRTLAADPAHRFQTATELLSVLRRIQDA